LALLLSPGEHKYAANVPGVPTGKAGEFTINGTELVMVGVRLEQTAPKVENGILIEKPQDYVYLFDIDPNSPKTETVVTVVDSWQPTSPSAGQGSLVWINHGSRDELVVDLNGQIYRVPPKQNEIPGRLQLDLPPETYNYTASVPYGAANGQIELVAGQIIGLNVVIETAPLEYDVGDDFDYTPEVTVIITQENLMAQLPAQVVTQTQTISDVTVTVPVKPETKAGIMVKNFTGETLLVTINNQVFSIVDRAEQSLPLLPGHYDYTISIPGAAITGTIDFTKNQAVSLSVTINMTRDKLTIYQ
jgi:hypothetical protein